jgi:hypothetical protein
MTERSINFHQITTITLANVAFWIRDFQQERNCYMSTVNLAKGRDLFHNIQFLRESGNKLHVIVTSGNHFKGSDCFLNVYTGLVKHF